jgi:hypothetical protein
VNPFLLPAFQKCFARAPSPLHTGNTPKQMTINSTLMEIFIQVEFESHIDIK